MPEIPVDPDMAQMLLNTGDLLGTQLETSRRQYLACLEACRAHLNMEYTQPFVQGLLRHMGCKDGATILLKDDGSMVVQGRRLQPLKALRQEAKELGVDISHLGRKIKAIRVYLDAVRESGQVSPDEVVKHDLPKKAGFSKTAPALSTRVVDP